MELITHIATYLHVKTVQVPGTTKLNHLTLRMGGHFSSGTVVSWSMPEL